MTEKRRAPLIAGNWKMHKTPEESEALAAAILDALPLERGFRIGIFPTAVSLTTVADRLGSAPGWKAGDLVGAQNMHFEAQGAFTGEISAEMVLAAGGNSVLLGHSERRHVFGEGDELIGKKVVKALEAGLIPILCVGETLEQRDSARTLDVVREQLAGGLAGVVDADDLGRIIIAYEPVWAIGTGRTATPDQAQEVHEIVREELRGAFSKRAGASDRAEESTILYGGSVKPDNAADLLARADIDGALVGGASLKADSFVGIAAGCGC